MSSKAQGLSLNTIVIAAIVLIVLLILVGMTTGYFGKWKTSFGKATDTSCEGQGGKEKDKCDSAKGERETFAEVGAGKVCCLKEKKTCDEYKSGALSGRCFSAGTDCGVRFPEGDWSCNGGICCP